MDPEELRLSILTPAVPSRFGQLEKLAEYIARISNGLNVEHLILMDNKKRTVGEKRDALLRTARGRFVLFVDDDDWVSEDYVLDICWAATDGPDVITFLQHATVDDKASTIEFKLGNPNDPFLPGGVTRRNAWHICGWKRTIAIQSRFPASNYGEDWAFAAPLCAIQGLREVHIPKVLHHYRHSSIRTEAPPPSHA